LAEQAARARGPLGELSETGLLSRLVLKHARDAFIDAASVDRQWRDLNFTAPPDVDAALREYDAFASLLGDDATVDWLPPTEGVGLDSIYVRDASVLTPRGVVLSSMGKPQRMGEPSAQRRQFEARGIPVVGTIEPPGQLEGGDVVWLDDRTVAVGWGYRTNREGIRQFETLLGNTVDACVIVPLPHWKGARDVFHLMSILSPVDDDLSVVYSPLMPVPFRMLLLERGCQLVEVPDDEFASMAANVLAVGPRRCVMLDGNPQTRKALERAGAEVRAYRGTEISLKGGGGPTCLTRPIVRNLP
jgi:N-dimethylarginine dimethylaminohydrolase